MTIKRALVGRAQAEPSNTGAKVAYRASLDEVARKNWQAWLPRQTGGDRGPQR
jgi:hypothetical protein